VSGPTKPPVAAPSPPMAPADDAPTGRRKRRGRKARRDSGQPDGDQSARDTQPMVPAVPKDLVADDAVLKPAASKAPGAPQAQNAALTEEDAHVPSATSSDDDAPADLPPEVFTVHRRKALTWVLVGAVVVAFLGWFVGSQIESPADIAAQSDTPSASPIIAKAENKQLSTNVVTRGTGAFGSPQPVTLPPSGFSEGRVVTSLPKVGDRIDEGESLATVSGRPVFVLQGSEPAFRDLGPGMCGQDVLQLEDSLARLGLNPGPVDALYDGTTEGAVRALYARAGRQPIAANLAQVEAIRPPEAAFDACARAGPGVQFPASELFFVPTAPVRVGDLPLAVGQAADGPLMTVSDSTVKVDGFVRVEDSKRVKEGMKVRIEEPGLGIDTEGTITSVAESPGTLGATQFQVHLDIAVEKPPEGLNGAPVRLTIPIRSTKGKVLAVPVSAVFTAADGSSRVQRVGKDGVEDLLVKTGVSAEGFVAVTPVKGKLKAGDEVVVGNNLSGG